MWLLLACVGPGPEPDAEPTRQRVWVEFSDDGARFTADCLSEPTIDATPKWLIDGVDGNPDALDCSTAVACSLNGQLSEASRPNEQFELVLRAEPIGDALLCDITCGQASDGAYALDWDGHPGALLWPQARAESNTCTAVGAIQASLVVEVGPADSVSVVELNGLGGDFGFAVAAEDVDADGAADLVFGAPKLGEPTYAGQVFVVSGLALGVPSVEVIEPLYEGEGVAAYAGWSVASADIDDDGAAEVLVGAPGDGALAYRGGAAHLVAGDGTPLESWLGPMTTGWAAVDVAARPDALIAGAYGVDEAAGAAYSLLDHGLDEALVRGDVEEAYVGLAVDFVGDTDGDGLDEWAAGAPGVDAVALVSGDEVDWLEGPEASLYGWDVAGVGDFDGDGLDDVLVAAPGTDQVWIGDLTLAHDARSVAGHGDQDLDGHTELLLGVPNEGSVWLVHADGTERSMTRERQFGWSLTSVPDLDGDGLDEVLIGALENDDGLQPSVLWMSPQD